MNRLAASTSPYLLQHKDNPVDWWQWSTEAFAESKKSGKPILLSIGYSACHWCHVMAHECFENESIARLMNELFVCIKLDREERPDVDHLYMSALHAMGEPGGWPLTIFLNHGGQPFWGGTYFPPTARYGKPGFPDILRQISRTYSNDPERIKKIADAMHQHLAAMTRPANDSTALSGTLLTQVADLILENQDSTNGGLKGAPKFPNTALLDLIARSADQSAKPAQLRIFLHTLERMARGGIQDHLGGGFARYTVDAQWLVPHFEKMLYDNAQLLPLYALAYQQEPNLITRQAAEGIVNWLTREMTVPGGAFASSLDADSEGEEGKFYVWHEDEIDKLLGAEAGLFKQIYGVTRDGNWEGATILNRLSTEPVAEQDEKRLLRARAALLRHREHRPRPGLDDKVLADWNALMIAGLAVSANTFSHPEWLDFAKGAYRFVMDRMRPDDRLQHSTRAGKFSGPAQALDLAALARAALVLHEHDQTPRLLDDAIQLVEIVQRDHAHVETGILAMSAADSQDIIIRPSPSNDDAVPNANALYVEALVRLAMLTGQGRWMAIADRLLHSLSGAILRNPIGHASLLAALDLRIRGLAVVIVGPPTSCAALVAAALAIPHNIRTVLLVDTVEQLPPDHSIRRAPSTNLAAAYICTNDRCTPPILSADALVNETRRLRTHP